MKLLKHQHWHALLLVLLLNAVYYLVRTHPRVLEGSLWEIPTRAWLLMALAVPVVHQVYVLLCWRAELLHKAISKRWGPKGFAYYKVGFAILILLRPVTILLLAFANAFTFQLGWNAALLISLLLFAQAAWLFYSVRRYFGIDRAFGIDHFQPETYRRAPMVKKGIFRYTSNGMYWFGFLALWIPGVLLRSEAAIVAALFNHLYIWVHFYFTELPDMKFIYGKNREP